MMIMTGPGLRVERHLVIQVLAGTTPQRMVSSMLYKGAFMIMTEPGIKVEPHLVIQGLARTTGQRKLSIVFV